MAKIYVSSTFLDLQEYRAQVERVIRRMGHEDVAMEYYVASDERPVEKCLADVAECDIYLGIYAWRYGWVPNNNNPEKYSITEMEYRQAEKSGKPCFIFLLSEDQPWARKFIDKDTVQIEKLRNDASEKHSCNPFTSHDDLARKVGEAIHSWEKKDGYILADGSIAHFDRDAYFNAMRRRFGVIALEGLTPPQREEYLQIQLRSVFVEQNVRENPPPVELPKEVWAKLEREKEIHADDLPEGVTLNDIRRAREAYFEKPSRPVLDILTNPVMSRVLILGDPGSGKSTLARFVLLSVLDPEGAFHSSQIVSLKTIAEHGTREPELNKEDEGFAKRRIAWTKQFENHLPVLIELRNFAALRADGKCDTFFEFLEYLSKTEGWHLDAAALRHYLQNEKRAVVIFDGLDEIFDPELRERTTLQIVAFADEFQKARILVTSRVIGYRRKILSDALFKHFTLQDLNEEQVSAFVNHWYKLALAERPDEAQERRERILRAFRESPSIRQLAGNPMLLTIMAIIGKHQELPRERWKLYDHAASVLIQHWDVNKHLKNQRIQADFIGEEDKKEFLRRLAFRMQSGEGGLAGNYVLGDELQSEFEAYLKERYNQGSGDATRIARAMIEQFRERNFILSLYGANLYGFVHRAFLEFFVAEAIRFKFEKTREITLDELKNYIYGVHWEDLNWHEVLRLISGMIDERWTGEIIDYLSIGVYLPWPNSIGRVLPLNVLLAIRCLGEVRNSGLIAEASSHLLEVLCLLFEVNISSEPRDRIREFYAFLRSELIPAAEEIGRDWPSRTFFAPWLRQRRISDYLMMDYKYVGEFIGSIGQGLDDVHEVLLSYLNNSLGREAFVVVALYALAKGWHDDPGTFALIRREIVSNQIERWYPHEASPLLAQKAVNVMVEYYADSPETMKVLQSVKDGNYHESVRVHVKKHIRRFLKSHQSYYTH